MSVSAIIYVLLVMIGLKFKLFFRLGQLSRKVYPLNQPHMSDTHGVLPHLLTPMNNKTIKQGELYTVLTKHIGHKCDTYEEGCATCEIWRAFEAEFKSINNDSQRVNKQ